MKVLSVAGWLESLSMKLWADGSIEAATNRKLIEHEFRRTMIGPPISEAEARLR
jgi:hypothetical protein